MAQTIPHQDVTPPPPNTLADKVGQTLAWAGQRTMLAIGDVLGTVIATALARFLDILEPHFLAKGQGMISKALANPGLPADIKDYLRSIEAGNNETDGVGGFLNRAAISILGFAGYMAPYNRLTQYQTERQVHTARLAPGDVLLAIRRGVLNEGEGNEQLADQGYTADYLARFRAMSKNLPAVNEIATAMFRGVISKEQATQKLREIGYEQPEIDLLQQIFPALPGISDLISMAVKEAFSPEIAEKFGQYQDFPARFAQEAAKQGLSDEWARAYWAAHWDLPSPTQGFEMLHRGLISKEDLALLLRALDVMPFWRDKLIGISYNPYTRVDTRRMYDSGILDRAGVKRAYLDQGYDEEHAENLTKWTTEETKVSERDLTKPDILAGITYDLLSTDEVRQRLLALDYSPDEVQYMIDLQMAKVKGKASEPDRALVKTELYAAYVNDFLTRNELSSNLSALGYDNREVTLLLELADVQKNKPQQEANRSIAQSQILSSYRDRLIDRSKAESMLTAVGYTEEQTGFLLAIADYQIEKDRVDDQVDTLHILYVNALLSDAELLTELNKLNLPDSAVQNYTYKWGFEKSKKAQHPTLSQLIQFYKAKVIDRPTLIEELAGLGYPDKYIAWYMDLTDKQTGLPA